MYATSNFDFLDSAYPKLASIGILAERNTYRDPSTSLVKLRLLSERITEFILNFEQIKEFDNEDQYHRIRILEKEGIIPREVCDAMHIIRKSGNGAAHNGKGTPQEVKFVLRQAVKLVKWFCTMYEDMDIPKEFVEPQKCENDAERIKALEEELAEATAQIIKYQKKVKQLSFLTHEQKEDRRIRASHLVRKIDEHESETRQRIDIQLRSVGWESLNTDSLLNKLNNDSVWPNTNEWNDSALRLGMQMENELG